MASANCTDGDDEWELVNDDGFVYKRKKRSHHHLTTTASAAPPPDPALAEAKNRLIRKKKALIKIKEKYEKEIENWEKLSKMLKEMELQAQKTLHVDYSKSDNVDKSCEAQGQSLEDSNFRIIVDELLAQADAQEAVIRNVSNLCDIADELCASEEERLKQSLIDLPIWAQSPRGIVTSLCKE